MDNKIEIILYLILGVGALIANVYRNYNKRKMDERKKAKMPSRTGNPTPQRQNPIFPDLETLLGIPKEEPKVDPWSEIDITEPEPVQNVQNVQNKIVEEGEAVFEETEEELVSDNMFAEDDFRISDFVHDTNNEEFAYEEKKSDFEFDPIKAVIYSEIMKRPDY